MGLPDPKIPPQSHCARHFMPSTLMNWNWKYIQFAITVKHLVLFIVPCICHADMRQLIELFLWITIGSFLIEISNYKETIFMVLTLSLR